MIGWLQNYSSVSGLKKFVQGFLAEPWREDYINQEENEAHSLESDYERGELKGEFRVISADTQTDSFWYVVRGFDRTGDSYLIDYGQVASFNDLDERYEQFHCAAGIVDCGGDRTAEIYEEVYRRRGKWFGSRGWSKMAEPYRMQMKDPFTGDNRGRANRGKFRYLHIDKGVWEPEIHQLRNRQMSGFYTYKETGQDYYKQLFAVYWVREADKNGHVKVVRKMKRNRGDHIFDCECMARALSKFYGIARADRNQANPLPGQVRKKNPNRVRTQKPQSNFW